MPYLAVAWTQESEEMYAICADEFLTLSPILRSYQQQNRTRLQDPRR